MARKKGEKLDITATLALLLVIPTHAQASVTLDKLQFAFQMHSNVLPCQL